MRTPDRSPCNVPPAPPAGLCTSAVLCAATRVPELSSRMVANARGRSGRCVDRPVHRLRGVVRAGVVAGTRVIRASGRLQPRLRCVPCPSQVPGTADDGRCMWRETRPSPDAHCTRRPLRRCDGMGTAARHRVRPSPARARHWSHDQAARSGDCFTCDSYPRRPSITTTRWRASVRWRWPSARGRRPG